MNEREFWIQVRRGLITVVAAIADGAPDEPFWNEVTEGFAVAVRAIDSRYQLPPSTRVPYGEGAILGTFTTEPPARPLAHANPNQNGAS